MEEKKTYLDVKKEIMELKNQKSKLSKDGNIIRHQYLDVEISQKEKILSKMVEEILPPDVKSIKAEISELKKQKNELSKDGNVIRHQYLDVEISQKEKKLSKMLDDMLSPEEKQLKAEINEYKEKMKNKEDSGNTNADPQYAYFKIMVSRKEVELEKLADERIAKMFEDLSEKEEEKNESEEVKSIEDKDSDIKLEEDKQSKEVEEPEPKPEPDSKPAPEPGLEPEKDTKKYPGTEPNPPIEEYPIVKESRLEKIADWFGNIGDAIKNSRFGKFIGRIFNKIKTFVANKVSKKSNIDLGTAKDDPKDFEPGLQKLHENREKRRQERIAEQERIENQPEDVVKRMEKALNGDYNPWQNEEAAKKVGTKEGVDKIMQESDERPNGKETEQEKEHE